MIIYYLMIGSDKNEYDRRKIIRKKDIDEKFLEIICIILFCFLLSIF
jgi:hypothetical protein